MGSRGSPFRHIAADELARWITPAEALAQVRKEMGGDEFAASASIVARLSDGLIIAGASTVVAAADYNDEVRGTNVMVLPSHWKAASGNVLGQLFWKTGDMQVWTDRGNTRVSYYGLRFDPAAISQVAPKPTPPQSTSDQSVPIATEPEQKGPPVSQTALEAWFKAYKIAFPDTQDTEARAMESARGCFPGKSFSRDAVRALRGTQRRGRKPDSAK